MTRSFKDVFDGKRQIHAATVLFWIPVMVYFLCSPAFWDFPPVAGIVVPFVSLIGIEWVMRCGEWLDSRTKD